MEPLKVILGVQEDEASLTDHRGNWLKGFVANFGTCSSIKAKLLALLKGLRLAR